MADDIVIQVIKPTDYTRVLDFLRKYFYPDEPLTSGSEPKQQDPEDELYTMSNIEHGTSVMAIQKTADGTELMVGVTISGPKTINEAEHLFEEAKKFGASKWGRILLFLACAERDANIFDYYNVDKVLHLVATCVDTRLRGKGIGLIMLEKSMSMGKELSYPVVTSDSSSYFSARLNERLGFECINTIFYKDYKDEHGEQVFRPPAPHEYVKTYAKRL